MSDYGFKTNDETRKISVNAKNPIFGFDMSHQPRAFKTFRITDAKTNPVQTAAIQEPNPQPSNSWGWAQNIGYGTVRELVKKVKHGYNFRPVGYATISGNMHLTQNIQIQQTQRAGDFGGNYTRGLTKTVGEGDYYIVPNISGHVWLSITAAAFGLPQAMLTESDFSGSTWPLPYPQQVMTQMMYGPSYAPDLQTETGFPEPIEVEIDDEYIYIYRSYWWSDTIRRAKFVWNGSVSYDIQERVKIANQYSGSTFNITVYLCPFPFKELLDSNKTPIV